MIEHQDQKVPRTAACPNCLRHRDHCICALVQPQQNRIRVVVLQHPQEQLKVFNSAKLLTMSLAHSRLEIGLSWRNHREVLDEGELPGDWGVLHLQGGDTYKPGDKPSEKSDAPPLQVFRKGKARTSDFQLRGIIILDGSWKQAKTLWWRNSWLLRLNRVSLNPDHASLRNQVRPDKLSTLEAAALTMRLLGEDPAIVETLQQQYRDLIIEPNKRPRKPRPASVSAPNNEPQS